MSRLFGVNLPGKKRLEIALQSIYGVGLHTARQVCDAANLEYALKAQELTDDQLSKIQSIISDTYTIEGDLRRLVATNIKNLKDINCYRGMRHRRNLPVHGQRTHSNARTRKGKSMPIAGKKKA